MRRKIRLSVTTSLAVAFFTLNAAAVPIVPLSYEADATCPDASRFLDAALQKSEGVVLERSAGPNAQALVTLHARDASFVGRLELKRRSGTYVREMNAASCMELSSALAFVLGLALVEEYGSQDGDKAPKTTAAPADVPERLPTPASSVDWWFGADMGARTGVSPVASMTEGVFLSYSVTKSLAPLFQAGLVRSEPNRATRADYSTEFSWAALRIDSCPVRLPLGDFIAFRPCVAVQGGPIWTSGFPVRQGGLGDSQSRFSVEAAGALRLELRPVPPVSVHLGLDALVPFRHYTFYFDSPYTEVLRTPAFAVAGSIGLSFRIR
jgi:hypothetical protein